MSRFDVRRSRIQREGVLQQRTIQQKQQTLKILTEDLPKTIVNMTDIIGTQQAKDWMDAANSEFNKAVANGKMSYKDDGVTPLSPDELMAARENWFNKYIEANPMPGNPWASQKINTALEESKNQWDSSIAEASLRMFEEDIVQRRNTHLNSLSDGEYHDPTATMNSLGITADNLSSEAIEYYNLSMSNEPDQKYSPILASQLFSAQLEFEMAGFPSSAAKAKVEREYQTAFADNIVIKNIGEAYKKTVIDNNGDESAFINNDLDTFISNLGEKDGYLMAPNDSKKQEIRYLATQEINRIRKEKEDNVTRVWQQNLMPAIFEFEDSGNRLTTTALNNLMSSVGMTSNDIRFLTPETQNLIHTVTNNNDKAEMTVSYLQELSHIMEQTQNVPETVKADMINKKISSITDPVVASRISGLARSSNGGSVYWDNASIKQLGLSLSTTFSGQPDVEAPSGVGQEVSPTSKFITDANYRTLGFNIVSEVFYPDSVTADIIALNDEILRDIYKEENPDAGIAYVFENGEAVGEKFGNPEIEKAYQKWKQQKSQEITEEYFSVKNETLPDGSTIESLFEESQKIHDARMQTELTRFFVHNGIPSLQKEAAANRDRAYNAIFNADTEEEISVVYMNMLAGDNTKLYLKEDYDELMELVRGDYNTKAKEKGIDLKAIIKQEIPGIDENSEIFDSILAYVGRVSKNDILGTTDSNTARANIRELAKNIYNDISISNTAFQIADNEKKIIKYDSFSDFKHIYDLEDSRILAGQYISGNPEYNGYIREDIATTFSGGIRTPDGTPMYTGAAEDAVQLSNIIMSDLGVEYTDDERYLLCIANRLNLNIDFNKVDVETAYNLLINNMPEDVFSRTLIFTEASTLYGLSDIYKELSEDWGLNNLTPINDGSSYRMGNMEIKPVINASGSIQKLEGRKLGSDSNWLDMTVLSPRNIETLENSLHVKAVEDYDFMDVRGIAGLLAKDKYDERNITSVENVVSDSQEAQAVLTMFKNLGIEKKFVPSGSGIKLISIKGDNNA